jgi:hypothetical protein
MDAQARFDVYSELADRYDRQGQAAMRDRFLVLAADAALSAGLTREAEHLRQRLLHANPHHLLKPYRTAAEAFRAADVRNYVRDLRETYPLEAAEGMLRLLRQDEGAAAPKATAPKPLAPAPREEPEVYAVRDEKPAARPPHPAPAPAPPPRPAPHREPAPPPPAAAAPRPQPAAPARVAPVAVLAPAPPPPRPRPFRGRHRTDPTPGAWLGSALFGLLVVAGTALAAFTFARPFLPAGWLP